MSDFTQTLQSWQMFYGATATAAVTLAGLLFVSLSISRSELDERARQYARGTFGNLTNVLALSLIFLIPHQQPEGLFVALLTFGAANLIATIASAAQAARGSARRLRVTAQVIKLPMLLCVGILAQAFLILFRVPSAMYWPIAIIVLLLSSACRNAWEILFPDARPAGAGDTEPTPVVDHASPVGLEAADGSLGASSSGVNLKQSAE